MNCCTQPLCPSSALTALATAPGVLGTVKEDSFAIMDCSAGSRALLLIC